MLIFLFLALSANGDTDGPWSFMGASGHSGEILMVPQTGSSMFYWQFNADNGDISTDTRPLIIWLEGGPGCSSENSLLGARMVPFYIDDNGNPQVNNATWTLFYHIIGIDFPYGAGFSYASQSSDYKNTTDGAVAYLYQFLQKLGTKYPSWFDRYVYIFGSSYAGRFIPQLTSTILSGNSVKSNVVINVKGIGLEGPWIDAYAQTQFYSYVAYDLGLLNINQSSIIHELENTLLNQLNQKNFSEAYQIFTSMLEDIYTYSNGSNIINIRDYGPVDLGNIATWLNLDSTKTLLNVPKGIKWSYCNIDVDHAFGADSMENNTVSTIANLLDSIDVLIYTTQDNLYVNTNGIINVIEKLPWEYVRNFLRSRRGVWMVSGSIAGYAQTYNKLTHVQLIGTGSLTGALKPLASRDMVNRFIFNQGWN